MAEVALGLGASVITFLALAGQTLRGCQYIHNFIEDARSSSKDLNDLSTEIECLQVAILGLQHLQERSGQSWTDGRIDTQAINAMEFGLAVIEDIAKFFKKFEPRTFEWWTGLKVASRRRQLAAYYRKLEAAKSQMIMVHCRLSLTSTLSQDERFQVLTASLQSSTNTTHLHLADLQRTMLALQDLTFNGIRNLQIEKEVMSRLLDELPTRLDSVIQTAITAALQEVSTETQSDSQLRASESRGVSHSLSSNASQGWYTGSGRFAGPQDVQPLRKVVRFVQQRTVLSFCFATIVIRSTATENPDINRNKNTMLQYPHESANLVSTVLDVRLRSCILRKGLIFSIINKPTRRYLPDSSLKLRLYSTVSENSPVVEACKQGNTDLVYEMFSTGRAHLQDVVILSRPTPLGVTEVSFLNYVWMTWILTVEELSSEESHSEGRILFGRLEKQYQLFRFLDITILDSHACRSISRTLAEALLAGSRDTLTTNQLHGPEDISDSGPCLWNILQLVSSSNPALTTAITKMITLFVEKSTVIFLQTTTPYQREMFEICCKLMPELGSCLEDFVKWHIGPGQDTDDSIRRESAELSTPSHRPIETGNGLYSLIQDPDALHFNSFLRHQVQPSNSHMIDSCILAQQNSSTLARTRHISSEAAVKARIIACLSFGMDIETPGTTNSDETVLGHFLCSGQIEVLQSAWVEAGMEPRLLDMMVEEYSCFFLVEELNTLRPSSRIMEFESYSERTEDSDATQPSDPFSHDLEMMRSKEYTRYLPEEVRYIETYLDKHSARVQDIEDKSRKAILRPEPDISLPAINGLSDDFWT